jgi:hypothetical protein
MPTPRQRLAMASKKIEARKFPVELRNIIDEFFDGNMAEYSRASKVANGTLGHYVSSNRYPTPERLESMLRPLQGKAQQRLLEAFLMDMVPPAVRGQIQVRRAGGGQTVKPAEIDPDLGVSKHTLSALEFMGRLAADNPAIRLAVEHMAKAMGWKG